jgi:transcriptional regulator with XRE-family HTH domain
MDISEIINDRIKSSGKSQAEIAKEIDTTPSQLGLFLKGEASLTRKSMNRCLEVLNIDLMMYKRRNDLAKRIAKALKAKRITDIGNLTKEDIIALTGEKALRLFREEDEHRFKEIKDSGYIDPESTYNYMKGLIGFYLAAPDVDKITNKQAQSTFEKVAPLAGLAAAALAATPIGAVVASVGLFGLISRNKGGRNSKKS